MDRAVKPERNGWRDETISRRHRDWGWNCPITDIDWLVAEYDQAKPIAIIEYKNEKAEAIPITHIQLQVLARLGDMAGLPVFAARYASDLSWFKVTPLNERARASLEKQRVMTELEFVTFLYRLRRRGLPPDIAKKLNGTKE